MTTLVMAHGGYDPGDGELRVPEGMQVDFYADFDEQMFFTNGLAVVARGQLGTPNEAYTGDDPIPNYGFEALHSEQLGWYLQLDRTGLPAWYVGDDLDSGIMLCDDKAGCEAAGTHSCTGLFGKAQAAGEKHLVILACRGNVTEEGEATRALVGSDGQWDTSVLDEIEQEAGRFLGLDEQQRAATWEGYPENTKTMLMTNPKHFTEIRTWAEAYGAKQLWHRDGPKAFATYFEQLSADVQDAISADPAAAAGVFAGRALNYFDADPAGFPAWFDSLDATAQGELLQDPGVYAWHQGRQGDAALGRAAGAGAAAAGAGAGGVAGRPSQDDLDLADELNTTALKQTADDQDGTWEVGGSMVLIGGTQHPAADLMRRQADYATGTFRVKRPRLGAGKVVFSGVPPTHQGVLTAAVERISDKRTEFV